MSRSRQWAWARVLFVCFAALMAYGWLDERSDAKARYSQTCVARGGISTYYCPRLSGTKFSLARWWRL